MIGAPPGVRSRRELLRGAATGTLALTTTGLLAASASAASTTAPLSVTQRLARLAGVELLLAYCYQHVLSASILKPHARTALAPFVQQARAHVNALGRELHARGGALPAGPGSVREADRYLAGRKVPERLGQLRGDKDALRLLLSAEQSAVGAYFVALLELQDRGLLELSAQMMANGAQHESVLRLLLPPRKLSASAPYGLVQGRQ